MPATSQGNFVDYYEILGVPDGATEPEIKRAYRQLAKACHPDYTGEAGHNMCILLNEAYDVLTNPAMRRVYDEALDSHLEDEGAGFTGKPMSKASRLGDDGPDSAESPREPSDKWGRGPLDVGGGLRRRDARRRHGMARCAQVVKNGMSKRPEGDTRAVFVDENSCIGCKQCVWVAPAMFRIEPEHGRSRVFAQWLNNEEEIETAIDACPVSCIHWVDERQLPYLEYAMAYLVDRVNVGVMMAGQGGGVGDVFDAAARFAIDRERREKEMNEARKWSPAQQAARKKAAEKMRQEMGAFGSAFFSSFVGSSDIAEDVVNAQSPLQEERLKRREEMRERRAKAKGTVKQELDELVRKAKR